jgi:hypothetical protein
LFISNELRVLAPDLEDRVDLGVHELRGRHLGRDLVAHLVGAEQLRGQVAAAPGGADGPHLQPLREAGADPVEALLDRLDRPPAGGQVDPLEHHVLRREQHEVGAHRADVHAEEGRHDLVAHGRRVLLRALVLAAGEVPEPRQ